MRVKEYVEISVATFKERFQTFFRSFDSIYSSEYYYSININGDDDESIAFSEKLMDTFDCDNICIMNHSLDLNYGDRAKFKPLTHFGSVEKRPDFFLTIDDDIIYPFNYVERMIDTCKKYNGIPVGVHAATIYTKDSKINNYFKERLVTHFSASSKRRFVNCLGTGTLCFSPEVVPISFEFFEKPNMCDCYFALYCQKWSIPMVCIERDINWLTELSHNGTTLWSQRGNGAEQTEVINKVERWVVNHA